MLSQGLEVGEHLAGMELIRQRIDHRNRCSRSDLVKSVLAEGPPHDRVDIAGQHPAGIGQCLVAAELSVAAVDHDGMPAELRDAHLEGEPGAGGVLIEDDRHTPGAFQWPPVKRRLLEFGR